MYTIDEKFEQVIREGSEKHGSVVEDLELLYKYGKKCRIITEFGVRHVISTLAWLKSAPNVLTCVDITDWPEFEQLREMAAMLPTQFNLVIADDSEIEIEPTELLFIDSLHKYAHLRKLLFKHESKVSKYLIIHDTEKNVASHVELTKAYQEFLDEHDDWVILERGYDLIVLTRAYEKEK